MRYGGILPFIPGIVSAIKSKQAHDKRVKAHRSYMDRLKQECGPNCKYSEAELHRIDDYKKQAREQSQQQALQNEALSQLDAEQPKGSGKKRLRTKGGHFGGVKKRKGGKFNIRH
jgi:hypothetical protein